MGHPDGTIDLAVPKLREGSYFPDWLLAPRRRAERAFVQVVCESYVRGVSTRRVEGLVRHLGIERISKSRPRSSLGELAPGARCGMELSGGIARGLAVALGTVGHAVVAVPPRLSSREVRRLRSRGKADPTMPSPWHGSRFANQGSRRFGPEMLRRT